VHSSIRLDREKRTILDQTASSCGFIGSGRTQALSYMICSCREPDGSTSMGAALAWFVYLTYDRPRGRPPYMYCWNLEMAVAASSWEPNSTTPVPRERPLGSYWISARSTLPMVVKSSIRSSLLVLQGRLRT
jgi:hypothetical protein